MRGLRNNHCVKHYLSRPFGNVSRSGYVLISADAGSGSGPGSGTVTGLTPLQDLIADAGENVYLELLNNQYSYGTLLATSPTVNINDAPYTVSITSDITTVHEIASGSATNSVTFTISTTGLNDGVILRCHIDAVAGTRIRSGDTYKDGTTNHQYGDHYYDYYDVNIQNNSATLKLNAVRDGKTEGNEQFKVVVKGTGTGNTNITLAESPTITIVDSSFVGLNKTDKTFGPIRVNRDQGNTSNTSDWYTICNLDKVPDGSKVALFIDTSGSMTMSTIQASYDLLVSKLNARGITFITVQNTSEDWISSFDTPL